jgi:hypothetical protein
MMRAALRGLGHAADVALLPEAGEPDLVARIGLGAERAPDEADRARLGAIVRRRTTRRAFAGEPVPEGLARRIAAAAEAAGAEAVLVTAAEGKAALAELVAEGDRAQFADPAFRRELGAWVHPRRTGDGISGASFGMPDALSAVGGLVIRTFDMGGGIAAKDEEIATASPCGSGAGRRSRRPPGGRSRRCWHGEADHEPCEKMRSLGARAPDPARDERSGREKKMGSTSMEQVAIMRSMHPPEASNTTGATEDAAGGFTVF